MNCPECGVGVFSVWQVFRASPWTKMTCDYCEAKLYPSEPLEWLANLVTYLASIVLIFLAFLYQSIWVLLVLVFVFSFYEYLKHKHIKWVAVKKA